MQPRMSNRNGVNRHLTARRKERAGELRLKGFSTRQISALLEQAGLSLEGAPGA